MPEERLSMRLDPMTRHWLAELMRLTRLGQSDAIRVAVLEAAQRRKARPYAAPEVPPELGPAGRADG